MGRGRAKAKQTKVARELKYSSPQTDFERLQRELSGADSGDADGNDAWDEEDDGAPLVVPPSSELLGQNLGCRPTSSTRVLLFPAFFTVPTPSSPDDGQSGSRAPARCRQG